MTFKKANGGRGSWFAEVNGTKYPCVHQHWLEGRLYDDPGYDPDRYPKFLELADAIRDQEMVVVTKDNVSGDDFRNLGFERTGYVALFKVRNVEAADGHLKFELAERVCDLR